MLCVSTESKTILADVLSNTGFFDDNSTEVHAWVCAFMNIKHYADVTEATTVFVNACTYVRSNVKDLCNLLNSIKENINQSSDSLSNGVLLDWSTLISCKLVTNTMCVLFTQVFDTKLILKTYYFI